MFPALGGLQPPQPLCLLRLCHSMYWSNKRSPKATSHDLVMVTLSSMNARLPLILVPIADSVENFDIISMEYGVLAVINEIRTMEKPNVHDCPFPVPHRYWNEIQKMPTKSLRVPPANFTLFCDLPLSPSEHYFFVVIKSGWQHDPRLSWNAETMTFGINIF